jgi:hypothetical protein
MKTIKIKSTDVTVLDAETAAMIKGALPELRTEGGKFIVTLRSVGNPDYNQNPHEDMWGVPRILAHVNTLEEASAICRAYIGFFAMGGGNWAGGNVFRAADGLQVGKISYNGRVQPV